MRNIMPSKSPQISSKVEDKLLELGKHICQHRKSLKLSATVVAESAGISRVTLHRIEKGEPSVTIGAYFLTMEVLGLNFKSVSQSLTSGLEESMDTKMWLPVSVKLNDYPQLKQLSWHVSGADTLTPKEALDIYERNWRYVDTEKIDQKEMDLVEALRSAFRENT